MTDSQTTLDGPEVDPELESQLRHAYLYGKIMGVVYSLVAFGFVWLAARYLV